MSNVQRVLQFTLTCFITHDKMGENLQLAAGYRTLEEILGKTASLAL